MPQFRARRSYVDVEEGKQGYAGWIRHLFGQLAKGSNRPQSQTGAPLKIPAKKVTKFVPERNSKRPLTRSLTPPAILRRDRNAFHIEIVCRAAWLPYTLQSKDSRIYHLVASVCRRTRVKTVPSYTAGMATGVLCMNASFVKEIGWATVQDSWLAHKTVHAWHGS